LRLVAQEAVKRKLDPHVGRGTIRILPIANHLTPCVAELGDTYTAAMEDLPESYERSDSLQPVALVVRAVRVVRPNGSSLPITEFHLLKTVTYDTLKFLLRRTCISQ
jgi:hypothetical protein